LWSSQLRILHQAFTKIVETCDKCLNKLGDMLKNECMMPKVFKFEVLNSEKFTRIC